MERALKESDPPPLLADEGDAASLLEALEQSRGYYSRLSPQTLLAFGKDRYSAAELLAGLDDIRAKFTEHGTTPPFFNYLKDGFTFYRSSASSVLFTGYYEARLKGSRTPSAQFQYPLYRVPDDLVKVNLNAFLNAEQRKGLPSILRGRLTPERTVQPYFSRDEIDFGQKLLNKKLELLWVDNLIDLFFMHIQGSGVVELDDGSELQVSFAESNGRPYRAIGALLLKEGALAKGDVSMQSIKSFLQGHPDRVREILSFNESYIFFRQVEKGPIGSIGVPLTGSRSIATDQSLFPRGALAFVRTKLPVFDENGQKTGEREFLRLMFNQDTGGAIKGPGRVDLYTGRGADAELIAGHLANEGELYFLAPKRALEQE